ncbi:hypothetical protein [Streptomyces aidingensis]|uniref:Uncharacterized protein n=1 Tax=Streptomyces aidingensis TaxID=910347 RepID=A0A1I1MYF8_9ACTN|nr:hypothetical protein [Streptomyces aidingensis]SFC90441.1 hypothetical protein SAMN05421773_107144 [Streptomyces aidingensis]
MSTPARRWLGEGADWDRRAPLVPVTVPQHWAAICCPGVPVLAALATGELHGPVIYRPARDTAYALVSPEGAARWRWPGTRVIGPGSVLVVPDPHRTPLAAGAPWWASPLRVLPDGGVPLVDPLGLRPVLAPLRA